MNFLYTTILISILLAINCLIAQTITATVDVKIKETIPLERREKLDNFQQLIENYINNYQWTNEEIEVEIPINVQIFFNSASSSGYEDQYNIQILISDPSDVQYFDKRCKMAYQKGEAIEHNDGNWTSLTSLLDFYINILLGDEMDKFSRFMGAEYFEKAKLIAEQAKFGMGAFIEGWEQRNDLIIEILSEENKKFREMKDFYFYGIFYAEEEPEKARKYCSAAVDLIEIILNKNPEHERCKKFLSAHYIELVDLFKTSEDKSIFQKLIKLDPDNEEVYQQYL